MNLASIVEVAKRQLLEEGMCLPTLYMQGDQGEDTFVLVFVPAPASFVEEAMMAWSAGLMAAQKASVGTLQRVYFVSEGTMVPPQKPGQRRQPKEGLSIRVLEVATGQREMIVYQVLRGQGTVDLVRNAETIVAIVDVVGAFVDGYQTGLADL